MQSKRSFFKEAIFSKTLFFRDLGRYWPVYVVVAIFTSIITSANTGSLVTESLTGLMPVAVFGWSFICAMLTFSYLFNRRLVFTMHSIPLRRDGQFITHLLSGLTMGFIPIGIMTWIGLMSNDRYIGWFLLYSILMLIAFYGISVFAIFLAGTRLGAVAWYGLLNFLVCVVQMVAYDVFSSMIWAVPSGNYEQLPVSPLTYMISNFKVLTRHDEYGWHVKSIEGEWYVIVLAAVGILLMLLSMLMYRHRKLERTGEHIIHKRVEKPFLLVCSVAGAFVGGYCLSAVFGGGVSGLSVAFIISTAICYFILKMVISRTVRIFDKRTFVVFAVILILLQVLVFTLYYDVFGISTYVPKRESVEGARIRIAYGGDIEYFSTDDGIITEILDIHKELAAAGQRGYYEKNADSYSYNSTTVVVAYKLKGGGELERQYRINHKETMDSAVLVEGSMLHRVCRAMSGYEELSGDVLGRPDASIDEICEQICDIDISLNKEVYNVNDYNLQKAAAELMPLLCSAVESDEAIAMRRHWYMGASNDICCVQISFKNGVVRTYYFKTSDSELCQAAYRITRGIFMNNN